MVFSDFNNLVSISKEDIVQEVYREHGQNIKIKKEKTLVKNLWAIFDAALRISNEIGFSAMSMRGLSRASGLSMGALYAYFSSKEELCRMLQHTGRSIIWKVLEERLSQVEDPLDRLQTGIETHLFLSEALQDWFYFSYMEARHLPEDEKERAKSGELKTEKLFSDIIDKGVGEGIFQVDDSRLAAALIKAMLQDWYVKRWKYAKRNVTVDRYAKMVIDWVKAYCLAPGLMEKEA